MADIAILCSRVYIIPAEVEVDLYKDIETTPFNNLTLVNNLVPDITGQARTRPEAVPQALTLKGLAAVKGPGKVKGFHISYDIL